MGLCVCACTAVLQLWCFMQKMCLHCRKTLHPNFSEHTTFILILVGDSLTTVTEEVAPVV